MDRLKKILLGALLIFNVPDVFAAEKLAIAVAADLKFAMAELINVFEKNHPDTHIEMVSGSSGKFYQQIVNGAPFDFYFSADIEYPRALEKNDMVASAPRTYAFGRLVVWSEKQSVENGLAALVGEQFVTVAIANPQHAPYGKAAKASLTFAGVWDRVSPKLVYGENVAQAAQFAQTGAADAAIIAYSLVNSAALKNKGHYVLIDARSHPPLEQAFVVLKRAKNNRIAQQFSTFISSDEARKIFIAYGFYLPGEQ